MPYKTNSGGKKNPQKKEMKKCGSTTDGKKKNKDWPKHQAVMPEKKDDSNFQDIKLGGWNSYKEC